MTWSKASREVISQAESASKSAEEAAEVSARASQEAISRAEKVGKAARKAADVSISAAKEATEASKKVAREAAETSVKVFEAWISGAEVTGKLSQPVARHTADAPTGTSREGDSQTKEDGEAPEETGEALAKTFGEVVNAAEANAKGKRGAKEVQKRIETRLESLARMYASNKARQTDEEEEN